MEEDLDLSENIARQLVAVSRAGSIVALDCTEAPPEIYLWPDEDEAIAKLHGFSSEEAIAFVSRALEGEGLVEYPFFNAAYCEVCHHVVGSRTSDDTNTCACGNLTVGGGIDRMERTAARGYRELALHAWAPPERRAELARYAEQGTTADTIQRRMLKCDPERTFTIVGTDASGAERRIQQNARAMWEAALLAREAEPDLVITEIVQNSS